MAKTHVQVASSHPLLCMGVRAVLSRAGSYVVTESRSSGELIARARRTRPDVYLVDEDLRGGALDAVRELVHVAGPGPVIVLADECNEDGLIAALFAGAQGYLSKDVRPNALLDALLAVRRGEPVIARRLTAALVAQVRAGRETGSDVTHPEPASERLTAREREVVDLVRAGMSTQAIASRLFVTPGTVRSHVHAVVRKFHVDGRAGLLEAPALTALVPQPRVSVEAG